MRALSTRALTELWQPAQGMLTPSLMKVEQSNSSIVYGRRLMLKIFRRVEPGLNPDIEIGLFLTGHSSLRAVPPMAGHFEYVSKEGTRTSLGVLQGYVANQGDAWQFALKGLWRTITGAAAKTQRLIRTKSRELRSSRWRTR